MLANRLKQYLVLLTDASLITLSLFLSYALRFGTVRLGEHISQILIILPLVLLVRISVFALHGLYRGMWRFVSTSDLVAIIRAISLSSLIYVSILYLGEHPRSV